MPQTQLYWIIGAVVVLIALGILIALMSRRRREDEVQHAVDARGESASRQTGGAVADRDPVAGDADVRTPHVAVERDAHASHGADGTATEPRSGATAAPALASFNVDDADRAAQERKAAERAEATGSRDSDTETEFSGPAFAGATALRAPEAETADGADVPVDPLEAAIAASPETEMTAAEIAAEAAARAAEDSASAKEAQPRAAAGRMEARDEVPGLAAAPATQAMAVVTPADHEQSAVGLAAAGVAGGTGVTVDENQGGVDLPEPVASTPIGSAEEDRRGSDAAIADAAAAAAAVQSAPRAETGSGAVAARGDVDGTPGLPGRIDAAVAPRPVVIDGTPGLPGRIAFDESPTADEAVAVTPHGDSREAATARREAAGPGLLGRAADAVKDKAAPLVDRAQPLTHKAAPLVDRAAPVAAKVVGAATPIVEKAVETAAPLLRKAVSFAKDTLAQAQDRRRGRK